MEIVFHKFYNVKAANTSLQSVKKEMFSCIDVPVAERQGVTSLESYLEIWLAEKHVQYWKCTSCCQCGSGVKKLVLEGVPELLIIQSKSFLNVEILVEKMYNWAKLQINKAVIGDRNYELKGVKYHLGSATMGHYTVAVSKVRKLVV